MADYAITAVARRVVYTGSAGLGPYSFSFPVLVAGDLAVYFNTTVLTITTDYTVSIGGAGTGTVTIVTGGSVSSTPDADDQITIVGARDIQRTADFVTAGDLLASSLNTELDSQTIFAQQVAEDAARALKAPVTDPTSINMTLPVKATRASKILGFDSDGDPETSVSSTGLASLSAITSEISTVAGISSNVTTVAGIAANVTAVAGDATDIGAVAAKATEIGRLGTADAVADMNTLGTAAIVTDMDLLGTSGNVTAMGLLGTSANVTAMGLLGTSGVITDMGILGTAAIVTDMDLLGTSANVTAMGLLGVSGVITDMDLLGTSANVTAMGLLGTSANVTAMGLLGTSAVVTDMALLGTSAVVADMDLLGTSANVTAMGLLGTSAVVADMALLGTTDAVADMALLGTADVISDMDTLAAVASSISNVASQAIGYTFSTTTTMADPGSAGLRFNAAVGSATAIAIDDLDNSGADVSPYVITWDDSTNTNKGTLIIRSGATASTFAIFTVTGLTDNSGWTQLAVTHVASNGTISNADTIFVSYIRSGNKGTDGSGSMSSFTMSDGSTTQAVSDGQTQTFAAGSGLSATVSATDTITYAGTDASTSAKGVASFHSDNFSVSSGAVTIKDGGVVEAEIADNAVTLAKMAGGTDGNIISFDASGDPVAIATGDDGQVLTSTGAGSPPAFEDAGGGAWAKVASSNGASNITEIEYTALGTKDVWMRLRGVSSTSSALGMSLRISQGGTFVTSGTGYNSSGAMFEGPAGYVSSDLEGQDEISLTPGSSGIPASGDANRDFTIDIHIFNPGGTTEHKTIRADWVAGNDGRAYHQLVAASFDTNTSAISGFKIYCRVSGDVTNFNYTSYEIMELN
jgi:hypothetical protein